MQEFGKTNWTLQLNIRKKYICYSGKFQVISRFSRLSRVLTTLLMLHIEINRFQYLCPGLNVVVVAAYVIAWSKNKGQDSPNDDVVSSSNWCGYDTVLSWKHPHDNYQIRPPYSAWHVGLVKHQFLLIW